MRPDLRVIHTNPAETARARENLQSMSYAERLAYFDARLARGDHLDLAAGTFTDLRRMSLLDIREAFAIGRLGLDVFVTGSEFVDASGPLTVDEIYRRRRLATGQDPGVPSRTADRLWTTSEIYAARRDPTAWR